MPFVFCRHSPEARQWCKWGREGLSQLRVWCLITQHQAQQLLTQNRWRSGRCKQKIPGRQTLCKHTQGRFDKNRPKPGLLGMTDLQSFRGPESWVCFPLRSSFEKIRNNVYKFKYIYGRQPRHSSPCLMQYEFQICCYMQDLCNVIGFFHIYLEWSQTKGGGAVYAHNNSESYFSWPTKLIWRTKWVMLKQSFNL